MIVMGQIMENMKNTVFLLLLAILFEVSASTSVIQQPKTFVQRKKPPKTVQVEILKHGENCSIRATKGDRAEV